MITQNSVIYQIVTDRFDDDYGTLYRKTFDPSYNLKISDYLGGTFNGIKNHLKYMKDLGITHVLLSPIQKSKSYHGYDFVDSFKINPSFGNKEDLKKLVEEFHKENISIILDYVATHVSSSHQLFRNALKGKKIEEDFFIFKNNISKDSEFKAYFDELIYKMTEGKKKELDSINPSDHLSFFGRSDMPFLNLKNPEVINYHKKVLNSWVDYFDDIRLDTAFLQPKSFISEITEFLKGKKKSLDCIAEYWDFEKNSNQCFGFCDGEFKIHTNLALNNLAFSKNSFNEILGNFIRSRSYLDKYKYLASINSHDLPRFKGGKNSQKIASILQFALPYTPLIYYGDEISMTQHNDATDRLAQSRDIMRFDLFENNLDIFDFYKKLINFRKKFDFSGYGISDSKINDNGNLFSFRFSNKNNENYYVLLNKEDRNKPIIPSELFPKTSLNNKDIITGEEIQVIGSGKMILNSRKGHILKENE